MVTISLWNNCFRKLAGMPARTLIVAVFLFYGVRGLAQPSPGKALPAYTPLDSWSFYDNTNWTSDAGYPPVSFAGLAFSHLGNGYSLVLDTNVPAWLQYNVVENDGTTNLTVDSGSVIFWYGPASWSSTNAGGTGPGGWAQLIDVGEWTPDASSGYWGLAVDPPGQNLWFQTQDGSGNSYSLSAPVSWTTNYFHFVVLTYSSTNVSLYLDGQLATNDPGGLSIWPGPAVLSNGFFVGSDTNGLMQAAGLFNSLYTYNVPLDAGTIQDDFAWESSLYLINPNNIAFMNLSSAPTTNTPTPTYDVISGLGNLQWVTNLAVQVYGTNGYNVWITNVAYAATGTNTATVTFSIAGGAPGWNYDVFATTGLTSPISNGQWVWMGQGTTCSTYALPNLPKGTVLLILGTPQDSDGDGLTDAYELLVSHTNPNNASTSGDGISDGDKVLLGLNPLAQYPAIPASLNVQTCPQ
jgi:hypothetical protein